MAQTSAGSVPIPPPKKDDSEDVAWALSTAEAMYARGDRSDALKWLRRAAESASEAEADDRALELAKAAADLAAIVGPTSMPPPAPAPRAPSVAPPVPATVPRAASVAPPPPVSAAPPPPPSAPRVGQAPPPIAAPSRPPPPPRTTSAPPPARSAPPPPAAAPKPVAPAARAGMQPKPAARAPLAVTPVAPRTTETARRTGRRSRPDIDFARQSDEPTQTMQDAPVPLHQPKRRGRASKPAASEITSPVALPEPAPTPRPAPSDSGPMPSGDPEAWPTQSLSGEDLPDDSQEKTRIGVPAYEASAKMASEASDQASTPSLGETPLRAAQALRVVVWRTPDGVRVAPHGTHVSAITVDAVLVALDPAADLAAWLSGK